MSIAHDDLVKALRTVRDPEIPVNIWDLGLIYALEISEGAVAVRMTLTAPNCPMADTIVRDVERRLSEVEGVSEVAVEIVWEPKWEPSMMSEAARLELEYTGHTGPAHLRRDPFSKLTIDRRGARGAPAARRADRFSLLRSDSQMGETVAFKRVASLSEIPASGGLCVQVGKRRIGLFRMGASICAVDDTCPHALASLCEGEVEGTEIVCPLHFATFDLRTGACTGPPAAADLATYKVRIVGDDVEIEV